VDPSTVTTQVVMTTNGVVANGTATDVATVSAFDQYGNPVPGAAVATTPVSSTLTVVKGTGTTTATGTTTLTYSSTSATTQQANVTVIDPLDATRTPQAVPPSPVSMNFVASAIDPSLSTFTVTPTTPQTAGKSFTLSAHAVDAQKNEVSGATITFSAATGSTLSAPTCQTNATGDCSVSVTSTIAGTYQVGATAPNASGVMTALSGSPQNVVFTAGPLCIAPACTPQPGVTNITKVVVTTQGVANDGTARDVATVYAYDEYGNAVPGAVVASSTNDSDLTVQPSIAATGANGTTTIWYTSLVAGGHNADVTAIDPLDATHTPQTVPGSPVTLQFGSGLVDVDTSSYTVTPASPLIVGTGADNTYTVTVTANDAFNKPVSGAVITFGITPGGPVWTNGTSTCATNASGQCSVTVYSTRAGTYDLSVLANGSQAIAPASGNSSSVAWQSDDVCASGCTPEPGTTAFTTVKVGQNGMTADGMSQDTAILNAYDKWGNAVQGVTVGVSTDDKALTVQPNPPFTDATGVSTVWFTSTKAGDHQATFTVKKLATATQTPAGSPVTLTFVPGPADASASTFSVDPTQQTVGGFVTATVTVNDANSNPVPGAKPAVAVTGAATTAQPAGGATPSCSAGTNADGQCVVTVSDAKQETTNVSATVAGGDIPTASDASAFTIPVVFGVGAVSATNSTVAVSPTTQTAGTNVTVTVSVKDVLDNAIDGLSADQIAVTGAYQANSGNPDGTVTPTFAVDPTSFSDLGGGVYTYQATSKLVGTFKLTAVVETTTLAQQPSVAFTAGAVCVDHCTPQDPGVDNGGVTGFVVTKDQQVADGNATDQVTAYAYDTMGNPVNSAAVVLNDTTGGALAGLLSPATATTTTGPNGQSVLSFKTTTAGSYKVAGTIGTLTPGVPGGTLTFVTGAVSASKSTLTVLPSSLTVGSPATATVHVNDANGNPVTGVTPTLSVDSSDAVLSSVTCASGVCTATVTSTVAGTYHVSATVPTASGDSPVSGSPAPVTFTAGPVCIAPDCTVTPPPGVDPASVTTRVVVDPNGVVANGTAVDVATVYAFDQYGNPVPGAAVATTAVEQTVKVVKGTGTTGAAGTATAGAATLTYSSTSTAVQHANVTIVDPLDATKTPKAVPPSPVELDFTSSAIDPGLSVFSVTPTTPQAVNYPFTLSVHAVDAQGNAVSGAVITFSAATGSALSAPTCKTDTLGDCSVTVNSTTAGDYQVGAKAPDDSGVMTPLKNSPQTVTWTPGPLCVAPDCTPQPGVTNVTKVVVTTQGVANDGTARDVATVYAYDEYGNAISGAPVASTTTDTDLAIQPSIAATGANGTSTIWYTSLAAGGHDADVTLVDPLDATHTPQLVPPSPITLQFGSGLVDADTSSYTVTPASPLIVGTGADSTYTVTVTANDAFNKPVSGAVITFGITPAGPVWGTNPSTCSTGDNGQCSAQVHSTRAGTYTVSVLANGSQAIAPATGNSSQVAWQSDDVCASGCTPEPGTTAFTTVKVGQNNMTADGMSQDTAILNAFDKWGNPVQGVTVGVSTTDTALTVQPNPPFTGADGVSTVWFTSTKAGDHQASFTVKKLATATQVPTGSPVMLTFVPGLPDPANSVLTIAPASDTLPQGQTFTATVVVKDALGNTVPGVPVTFTSDGSATVTDPASTVTVNSDATGTAVGHITDAVPEQVTLHATIADPNGTPAGVQTDVKDSPVALTFLDTTTPPAPVVTSPTPNQVLATETPTITGTAQPGTTVTVTDTQGTAKAAPVCTAVADAQGNWSCTPLTPVPEGSSTLSATATNTGNLDPATNTSPATTVPVTVDTSTPPAPTITSPKDGTKTNNPAPTVTGTGVPGDGVTVSDGKGGTLCTTTVKPDGTYTCDMPAGTTLPNGVTTLGVTQTNPNNGNTSPAATVSVDVNTIPPTTPTITTANATTLGGTSDPGTTVTVTWPDGTLTKNVPVDPDGHWSLPVPAGMPSGPVSAVARDPYGNDSKPCTAHLDTDVAGAPVFTTANATKVAGKTTGAEPGSTVTITWPDGTVLPDIPVAGDGTFSVPTPAGMKSGEITAVVVGPGPAHNTSPKGTGYLDTSIPPAPKVDPTDGTKVTGTAEPGDAITITDGNGTPIPGCTDVTSDITTGAFSCVPATPLQPGSQVRVTATDPAGNTSPATVVTVQAKTKIGTGGSALTPALPAAAAGGFFVGTMACVLAFIARRRKVTER